VQIWEADKGVVKKHGRIESNQLHCASA